MPGRGIQRHPLAAPAPSSQPQTTKPLSHHLVCPTFLVRFCNIWHTLRPLTFPDQLAETTRTPPPDPPLVGTTLFDLPDRAFTNWSAVVSYAGLQRAEPDTNGLIPTVRRHGCGRLSAKRGEC
ncbi:hypothetical protein E2C01_073512 [Portunus trituberculatus]|uniref:Uncharacterized protein n=1 Tax=Portunus trituberculatus TaxID=210409 RepID=A0A5B7I0V3_PORTR|nr:hypothetical protein [Portunus trituberculatus]